MDAEVVNVAPRRVDVLMGFSLDALEVSDTGSPLLGVVVRLLLVLETSDS